MFTDINPWVPNVFGTRSMDQKALGVLLVHGTHLILSSYIIQYAVVIVKCICEKN